VESKKSGFPENALDHQLGDVVGGGQDEQPKETT
jgi:hypothetical protein